MKELALKIFAISKELILNTPGFWEAHSDERESQDELFKNLLFPLLAVVAVAIFLGEFFRSDYFRIWVALLWIIREFVLFGALYFVGVYGTNKMFKYYGYEQKVEVLQILVAYSLVPFLLVSIVTGLLPFIYFLDIFGLYGFYIFMVGSKKMLLFPNEKRENLILKTFAANWIVFGLLSFTMAKLLMTID